MMTDNLKLLMLTFIMNV